MKKIALLLLAATLLVAGCVQQTAPRPTAPTATPTATPATGINASAQQAISDIGSISAEINQSIQDLATIDNLTLP